MAKSALAGAEAARPSASTPIAKTSFFIVKPPVLRFPCRLHREADDYKKPQLPCPRSAPVMAHRVVLLRLCLVPAPQAVVLPAVVPGRSLAILSGPTCTVAEHDDGIIGARHGRCRQTKRQHADRKSRLPHTFSSRIRPDQVPIDGTGR